VFAVIWLLVYRSRHYRRLVTAVGVTAALASLAARFWLAADSANADRIYYGTDTRLDGIALGVLTAVLYHRWLHEPEAFPRLRRLVARDSAFVAAVLLYLFSLAYRDPLFRDTVRFLIQSMAACLVILFGLLAAGSPASRLLGRLSASTLIRIVGLASYSVYLVHLVLDSKIEPWLPSHPRPLHFTLLVVIGVAAGCVVYRVVEVPFEKVRARLHRDVATTQADGAPLASATATSRA